MALTVSYEAGKLANKRIKIKLGKSLIILNKKQMQPDEGRKDDGNGFFRNKLF